MTIRTVGTVPERLSAAAFRAFQDSRPDHERWELIAGVPVMMTPPTLAHNRIAGNLERLLNDALARSHPDLVANQRPGVELGAIGDDFRPEPDVAVIDAHFASGQRFVDRAVLIAEIVSASDREAVSGSDDWITIKRRLYRAHPPCTVILVVEQDRVQVTVERRHGEVWTLETLAGLDARLMLADVGLQCRLGALYAGTPLVAADREH